VLPPILQDVDERVSYFARRREQPCVVSVGPDRAVASEQRFSAFAARMASPWTPERIAEGLSASTSKWM
jgi:hypothetical protein